MALAGYDAQDGLDKHLTMLHNGLTKARTALALAEGDVEAVYVGGIGGDAREVGAKR